MLNRIRKLPYTPLQIIMHLYAWSALVRLVFDFFTRNLTANPIQAMEQRTGRAAITMLVLMLACAPLSNLFGWRELLKRRRALGLYALMYATIHVIIFIDLDYGLAWSLIIQTVAEKPYILFGMTAFLMLIPLGITSFDIWKVRLGKNWKRLHQMVYFVALVAAYHFILSKKGNLFRLQGDIVRPLIYTLIILTLLAVRLPFVRRFFASLRTRILPPFSKPNPQPKMDIQQ